jgi:Family of unknown function (DUF6941)
MRAKQIPKKKPPKTTPVCKAILLCDDVASDPASGKSNVFGIFDTFYVSSFPGQTTLCKRFLFLVDAAGSYTVAAEIHDPAQGVILFSSRGGRGFRTRGRKQKREIWLPVPALPFDRPGAYDLVLFADEDEVGRVQFDVRSPRAPSHVENRKAQS